MPRRSEGSFFGGGRDWSGKRKKKNMARKKKKKNMGEKCFFPFFFHVFIVWYPGFG